jgi:hypothetical protein
VFTWLHKATLTAIVAVAVLAATSCTTTPTSGHNSTSPAPASAATPSAHSNPTENPASTKAPLESNFPGPADTGVQPDVKLKPFYGTFFADKQGMVIQDLEIHGVISVSAPDVTIENVRVVCAGPWFAIHQEDSAQNLTIKDTELTAPSGTKCQYGVMATANGTIMSRVNIHGVTDAVEPAGGDVLEDSWIHDLVFHPGDHVAAFGFDGGNNKPIVIRHNNLSDPTNSSNNLIATYSQNGPIANLTVEDNLLAGSGHEIWAGARSGDGTDTGGCHNVRVIGNLFSTRYWPKGGFWGPVAGYSPSAPGNMWRLNKWADGPNRGQSVIP